MKWLETVIPAMRVMTVNFWPWLLGAAIAGAGTAGYATFAVTRAFYKDEALAARLQLAKFETSLADARAELLSRSQAVTDAVMEKRDDERNRLDAVAADVRDLGQRVQLCATKSDVRVSVTPGGSLEAIPGGQLRDLADAVRDFATACAHQRDRDSSDHNALIDWLEQVREK